MRGDGGGREAAFTSFVLARAGHLRHAADLLVGDRLAAEDLLQTALTRTFAAWGRVQDPEAYTRRVLARLAVDRWRRQGWREVPVAALPEHAVVGDVEGGAARRDEVQRALGLLTPRERAVIVLRYWDDLSEVDIAVALGIAPGTVKSTAARALNRLRDNAFRSEPSTGRDDRG